MPDLLHVIGASFAAASRRLLARVPKSRLGRCSRSTRRAPVMSMRLRARALGPAAAVMILCTLPAEAQSLVTICTNGTFTWTYTFDLANGTVDMQGAFHWRGHADIAEDRITWNRDGGGVQRP